jgi:hypothetical protein
VRLSETKSAQAVVFPGNRSKLIAGTGNSEKLSASQRQMLAIVLVEWHYVPKHNGAPHSLAELARMLGLPVWTLLRIKSSAEFKDEIKERVRSMHLDAVLSVMDAMITKALEGKSQHIKLFWECAERLGVFETSRHSE